MSITVKRIREELTIEDTPSGKVVTEPWLVTGLPPDKTRPLSAAVDSTRIPQLGVGYGRWGIQVTRRRFTPRGVNGGRAILTYSVPDESEEPVGDDADSGRIELRAGSATERRLTDIEGNRLLVTYRGDAALGRLTKFAEAEVQVPIFRLTIRRSEDTLPLDKAVAFTGRVNSTPFEGFAEKTLLILGISSTEQNKGVKNEVVYELAFKTDTWRFLAKILIGGVVPVDAEIGNGLEFYDVYGARDFSGLGLRMRR